MNSARPRARPEILKYHRRLGLAAGLFVLIQGVTGSLIAFRYELNRALHPAAMIVAPGERQAPLQALIKAAQKSLPGYKFLRIDYPRQADDAYIVRLAGKSGNLAIATVDPAGHVTRAGPLSDWPVEFAYQLHMGFFYGGEGWTGYVGFAVLIMTLTGLLYWWPAGGRYRQAFRADLGNWRRATRGLHRLCGVVLSLLLIVMAGTGTLLAWTPWLRPAVAIALPFVPSHAPKAPSPCTRPADIDRDVAAAAAARPGEAIKSVRMQTRGRIVAVYFQSPIAFPTRVTDHAWIDVCSARLLAIEDQADAKAGDWFFNWLLPLHSGDWLGLPTRLLSWAGALTLLFMSLTGYALWGVRLAQRRRAKAPRPAAGEAGR